MTQSTPQQMPPIPPPAVVYAASAPNDFFDAWEKECNRVRAANDELFTKDLKYMNLCAFFNGMLSRSTSKHFNWCPQPTWEAYWVEQDWPKLSVINLDL